MGATESSVQWTHGVNRDQCPVELTRQKVHDKQVRRARVSKLFFWGGGYYLTYVVKNAEFNMQAQVSAMQCQMHKCLGQTVHVSALWQKSALMGRPPCTAGCVACNKQEPRKQVNKEGWGRVCVRERECVSECMVLHI